MKVLVLSQKHGLLPFAYRLTREGHDVEVLVEKPRYRKAWKGRLKSFEPPEGTDAETLRKAVRESAEESGAVVLTDSARWTKEFDGYDKLFASVPSDEVLPEPGICAWWNGTQFVGRHLFLTEWGLWPGGMGSLVPGAGVLVRPELWDSRFEQALLALQPQLEGFRGLVRAHLGVEGDNGEAELKVAGWSGGWQFLHTHAFVSDLENLGDVLEGLEPMFPHKYVVVAPLSVPPWPTACNVNANPAPLLTTQGEPFPKDLLKHFFFHDVVVEEEGVRLAGIDGLLGVVRGSANNLQLAQQRALNLLQHTGLPERQFRQDLATTTGVALAHLEGMGFQL